MNYAGTTFGTFASFGKSLVFSGFSIDSLSKETQAMQRMMQLCSLALTGALCLLTAGTINAQTVYFTKDTRINYEVKHPAVVGKDGQNNFYSPTIDLVPGGIFDYNVVVFSDSMFNISGGSLIGNTSGRGILSAFDTSTVNMDSGSISLFLFAFQHTTITMHA